MKFNVGDIVRIDGSIVIIALVVSEMGAVLKWDVRIVETNLKQRIQKRHVEIVKKNILKHSVIMILM